MFKVRNLMIFIAVFGFSLAGGVFADEPSKTEAAATTTTAVAPQPAAEVKAPEEKDAVKVEKKEARKDRKAKKGCGCGNKGCGRDKAIAEQSGNEVKKDESASATAAGTDSNKN